MCVDLIPKMQAKSPGGKSLGNLISRDAWKFQAPCQKCYAIRCLWFSCHVPPGEFMSVVVRESYVPWCLGTVTRAAWELYILCLSAFGIYVACCVRNVCHVLSEKCIVTCCFLGDLCNNLYRNVTCSVWILYFMSLRLGNVCRVLRLKFMSRAIW